MFGDKAKQDIESLIEASEKFDITEEDLIGASGGLFLLQETYNFNLTEFAMGKIKIPEAQVRERGGKERYVEDSPLTTHDLENLGKIAFNRNHFDRAYDFFKVNIITHNP